MLYSKNIKQEEKEYDLIVCGAGMSGFGAALAAAEEGLIFGALSSDLRLLLPRICVPIV